MNHLVLIDASGLIYRAHFTRAAVRRADGMRVETVLGFAQILWDLMGRAQADPYDFIACVFDAPGKTFRHKLFPDYKANRVRPDGFNEQINATRQVATALGLHAVEREGFEADDVIATLAHRANRVGTRTTIVTVDKDFGQCVRDGMVEIVDPVSKKRIQSAQVIDKFGVSPALVPEVQALCGDAVDGIPGVPGVGMKTAARLIRTYGSVDGVMRAIADRKATITVPPSVRAASGRERKMIPVYRQLATLRTDVDLQVRFADMRPREVKRADLDALLRALGAETMFANLFRLPGAKPESRPVPKIEGDPMEWWSEELVAPGQAVPDLPQCGYYWRRMFRGGPSLAVRIWREPEVDPITRKPTGSDVLRCEVSGERRDPFDVWGYVCANAITQTEFRRLSKRAKPTSLNGEPPRAEPPKADWLNMPAPKFKKGRS